MAITTITRNITAAEPGGQPWLVQAYSADVTGTELLKAGVAGTQHFIDSIHVVMAPGTTAAYWVLTGGGDELMPKIDGIDYSTDFYHKFINPLPVDVGDDISIDSEAADQIAVIMEGRSRQSDPHGLAKVADVSVSASPSISASVSSTPSGSPSVSTSVSSSPSASASISASPSWSG